MKKALSIMFALLLLFLLPACGGDEEEDDWGNDGDGGNSGNNEENGGWESQEGQEGKILKFEDDLSKSFLQQIVMGLDDEIYVAGFTYDNLYAERSGKNDPFLLAIDPKGKKLWGKQWGVPVINSSNNDVSGLSIDSDGNIYVSIYGNPSITKFSPDGTKVWEIFPDLLKGNLSRLTFDKHNNFFIGVYNHYNDGISDIIKYSAQGKVLQSYNISGNSSNPTGGETHISALAVDSEDNIYAGGSTYNSLFAENAGIIDAFLVKLAPDGTQLWGKQWGTKGEDSVRSILLDNHNNIFVTSGLNTTSNNAKDRATLNLKFSPNGDKILETNYSCNKATMCNDNIYCINNNQIYKYNSNGEYLGNLIACEADSLKTIVCDNKENVYVSTARSIKIIKFSPSDFK